MNTYECMYILQANLSDDENEKAGRRIVEEIEKRGGSMLHRDRLGKKRLAYRIRTHDDGVYYLMHFELSPGEIASLRAAYKLHPRLIRLLILRKEQEEIPKPQKRVSPAPVEPEAAPEEKAEAGAAQSAPDAVEKEPLVEEASAAATPEAEPTTQE